jgi:hypothetical protein
MQYLFELMPAIYLCLLFTVLAIVVTRLGFSLFKKLFNYEQLQKNKDVLTNMFATVCLIYSLILAFVIVAVWEDYEDVNSAIIQETEKLQDIRMQANGLPGDFKQKITDDVDFYVQHELANLKVNDDKLVDKTHLVKLKYSILNIDTANGVTAKVADAINDDIENVLDLRHERNSHTQSHIPRLVWLILIVGSIIVVFFSYLFLAGTGWGEHLYISLFVAMLAMSLFLIYALDHPFTGTSGVSIEPFREVMSVRI